MRNVAASNEPLEILERIYGSVTVVKLLKRSFRCVASGNANEYSNHDISLANEIAFALDVIKVDNHHYGPLGMKNNTKLNSKLNLNCLRVTGTTLIFESDVRWRAT